MGTVRHGRSGPPQAGHVVGAGEGAAPDATGAPSARPAEWVAGTGQPYLGSVQSPPVARLSPRQRAWRGRLETVLRVAGPGLDLVVGTAERVGRTGASAERWVVRRLPSRARAPRHSDRKSA